MDHLRDRQGVEVSASARISSESILTGRAIGRLSSDPVLQCLQSALADSDLIQAVACTKAVLIRTESKLAELVGTCRAHGVSWANITTMLGEPNRSVVQKRYATKGIQ